MRPILNVRSLNKRFPIDRRSAVWAVDDVSFSIGRGETLGLVGESGSGKTTVGRCILYLLEPDSGLIEFDGVDLAALSGRDRRALRHRMAIVFQDPRDALNVLRSVRQTVEEPLILQGGIDARERRRRVAETIEAVGLKQTDLGRYPLQLTGSEQQRLGIARAIVTRPDLVVVDEATSNLDPASRSEVLDLFVDLQARYQMSYLFISHDMTAVERVSHRMAIMYLGRIVETAPTADIFRRQLHPYSRGLISSVLYADPNRRLEPFVLEGEIPTAINPPPACSLISRCPFTEARCGDGKPPLARIAEGRYSACVRSGEFLADDAIPLPISAGEHV